MDVQTSSLSSLMSRSMRILEETEKSICALKLNRQLVLPLGPRRVAKIVKLAHNFDLPVIMDCKINDIGFTNRAIAEHYFSLGFDAVTANPFVGWVGGLDAVFQSAEEYGAGVILLVLMSHPGSFEGYGQTVIDSVNGETSPQYLVFAKKAMTWNADGIVVGATFVERLEEIHRAVQGKLSIYCPGVGAQGGKIAEAVRSGADYFIVGRTIYNSDNPGKVAEQLRATSVARG
ncbi:MAG: orotidine-5'-phosphate decarboxylase [Candidatus Bathyarchaeota archaeon]|nr:MAG: orotidine-5'-phosphate decarboxylase [Candidatus Bathyarchaeota archaeon]